MTNTKIQITLVHGLTGIFAFFSKAYTGLNTGIDKQFDRIIDIARAAFANDIVIQSMFAGDQTLSIQGTRALYRAGLLEGSILIATQTNSDEILGVALRFGPGKGVYVTEAQRALGYNDLLASYPEHLKAWWAELTQKHRQFKEEAVGLDRILQSWYVENIAIDPAHQGRGIGSALIKATCAQAEKDGVPLYLNAMSEYNVSWYKKLGFKEKGTIEYTALPALGGEMCRSTLLAWGEPE